MLERLFRFQAKETAFESFTRFHKAERAFVEAQDRVTKLRLEYEEFEGYDRLIAQWTQEGVVDELKAKISDGPTMRRKAVFLSIIPIPLPAANLNKVLAERKQNRLINKALETTLYEADALSQMYPGDQIPPEAAQAYAWDEGVIQGRPPLRTDNGYGIPVPAVPQDSGQAVE